MPGDQLNQNIYKASRCIKRRDNSLYNALRSIYHDSIFVAEIAQLWPELPLVANLRCGLWYSSHFESTCYFKSTDGHNHNWSFSMSRLNMHIARLSGQRGGCIIVDSTRKGKRFPDSMSKTIPIWACVLNRAIRNRLLRKAGEKENYVEGSNSPECQNLATSDWDSSLHLPLWISKAERASIEDRLEQWTTQFESSGADIDSLVLSLKKPIRPLWISQKTVIWLNEVPDSYRWSFTPLILVSASSPNGMIQQSLLSEYSWHYIPGAGDDEESWARGLSPELFWKHVFEIIDWGPELCNQKVAELIEKDRVYRNQRGEEVPQMIIKTHKLHTSNDFDNKVLVAKSEVANHGHSISDTNMKSLVQLSFFWIGSTNLAIGSTLCYLHGPKPTPSPNRCQSPDDPRVGSLSKDIDCILSCGHDILTSHSSDAATYLHLPIMSSKMDRFSLQQNLFSAIEFAKVHLNEKKRLLVCCRNGEDISVCVALAIFISQFNSEGTFDGGKSFTEVPVTKSEIRKRLIFICKYAASARPSRGNLKQVFSYLLGERERIFALKDHI